MDPTTNATSVVLASTARTSDTNSDSQKNDRHKGGHFVIDVSSITSAPDITPRVQGFDPVADEWYDILVGSSITTTGTTVLKVYPGIEPSANGAANDILPQRWRVRVVHANTDSITYSVAATLVV